MDFETGTAFILSFLKTNEPFFGPSSATITERLNAAIFPDELSKFGKSRCGLYMISTVPDMLIRYVGISNNIEHRIYQHMGKNITWARNGQAAHFPNCKLADGRSWQSEEEIKLLRNAEWEVTGVFLDPPHLAGLLEMAIVHFAKVHGADVTINVAFGPEISAAQQV